MIIGCVKEIKKHEYRVGMTPDNAKEYTHHGHTVLIETAAGIGAGFSDQDYINSGATIIYTAEEVWEKADMIIKVKEPLAPEYELMRENQIIYTYLHLAADEKLTLKMMEKKVKGVAYETIKDRHGNLPCLKPMSEIAGKLSVQEGAKFLEKPFGGAGVLLGGVPGTPKANVTIIGGGVVGTSACKIAVGMGANVTIIDLNLDRLTYLDDIFGDRIQTLFSTQANIEKAVLNADLVVGAVLIPGAAAPKLLKREYLAKMRPGSVIVDVAIDQGGCSEFAKLTYHDEPVFMLDGVVNYCVGNMPGAVPRTSTIALTNSTLRYGLMIADMGLEQAAKRSVDILEGINTYDGKCTYKAVAETFGLEYTPYVAK